eukprot:s3474_g10.t1
MVAGDNGPGIASFDEFSSVAVALGDIDFHFVWQAWHLATSTFTFRGGTSGTGLGLVTRLGVALGDIDLHFVWQAWHFWHSAGSGDALGSGLVPFDAAAFCVAGVALGDVDFHFVWHVWHLATSTFTLCGRRGTSGTGLGLVTRLGPAWSAVTPRRFAWQAWHLVTSTSTLCGRRGIWRHRPSVCVAGVGGTW